MAGGMVQDQLHKENPWVGLALELAQVDGQMCPSGKVPLEWPRATLGLVLMAFKKYLKNL